MPPRQKPVAQFAVVQQSYEDPEAEDKPKPVLVPVSTKTHRPKRAVQFMEDMDDDELDVHRLNMRMADDAVEDRIFDDEVEEDFDTDWIKQMMTGDGIIDSEEEYDEYEDDEYPHHEERRDIEKMFDRQMRDFDMDGDVQEDDPRAHGPLDVMDYAPALEQFMQDHAGASYFNPDDAAHHRGLVNQVRGLSRAHRVYERTKEGGEFVVALDPDKGRRMAGFYAQDNQALKEETLQRIREGEIDTTDVLYRDDKDEKLVPLDLPRKERMDCETVLSQYTNVYNNPTVLAAGTKKIKLSLAPAKRAKDDKARHADPQTGAGKAKSPAMGPTKVTSGKAGAAPVEPAPLQEPTEEELFADLPDEALPSMMDLSTRPKDESKEEKKLRRALVKEMQRERRAEKKTTRTAYRAAGTAHQAVDAKQKQDKKIVPMSVVRRI